MQLLERGPYLSELNGLLRQTAIGQGRLVFLGGEAGVGKTALVRSFSDDAAPHARVLIGSCDPLSTPRPLGPVLDIATVIGGELDRLVAAATPRHLLLHAFLAELDQASTPTVVIIEDVHWADEASLDLLRFLGRRLGASHGLVIATYRDDEIGTAHPLRRVLGDLATAPAVRRLALAPLTLDGVRVLVEGSGLDAVALHRQTGGNPFYATEILALGAPGIPATVRDAVLARAARLSAGAREALDAAAVIGVTIEPGLLRDVDGATTAVIEECIDSGVLSAAGADLAFRHELARQAVIQKISPPRRIELHARILAVLRTQTWPPPDPARLAHHAEEAGDRDAVLMYAPAAAERAASLRSHREAAAQYARALRFADGLPAAERARLFEDRSVACYMCEQGEEAIAARQAALDIWRNLGDTLKEGESLLWMSRFFTYWSAGRDAEAEGAATAALEKLESLPPGPELAMAHSNLARLRMLDNDLDGTLLWGNRAIDLAEQLGETETLIHALTNVGAARYYAGDEQGLEEMTRSLQLALAAGLFDYAGRALIVLAWTTMLTLRLDEADRRIAAAIAFALEHDFDFRRWYLLAGRATLRARQGAWDEAESEIRDLFRQPILSPVTRLVALTTLGLVHARRARPEAAAALDEALTLADRNGQLIRVAPVRAARAEAALLEGDGARARKEVEAVQDLVFTHGNCWLQGEFAWLLWQTGDRDIPTDNLAAPYALHIAGNWAEAAAHWRALGCPYEVAWALADSDDEPSMRYAHAEFTRLGAAPAAMVSRLREMGARGVPRGPRAATLTHPALLTRREAEILTLLAEGLSNAQIADRIFLSPKTVGHHVSAILAKLGVQTRSGAVREAMRRGLHAQSGDPPHPN
jgi:DNA-binding CsgD family transcriptional regulator